MESSMKHMALDFNASSCGLHVRAGNRGALALYNHALNFSTLNSQVILTLSLSLSLALDLNVCVCLYRLNRRGGLGGGGSRNAEATLDPHPVKSP